MAMETFFYQLSLWMVYLSSIFHLLPLIYPLTNKCQSELQGCSPTTKSHFTVYSIQWACLCCVVPTCTSWIFSASPPRRGWAGRTCRRPDTSRSGSRCSPSGSCGTPHTGPAHHQHHPHSQPIIFLIVLRSRFVFGRLRLQWTAAF